MPDANITPSPSDPSVPLDPVVPPVKVSVLMPVYNTDESHLREAIDSILSQTFRDFEFLIINDASPDPNVEKVVLSYDDPRIKYSRNRENMGISRTRNKLIEESRGEYLAVMDHDDISLPERFRKEVEYLDAHPGIGVVGCQVIQFGKKPRHSSFPVDDDAIRVTLTTACPILHPACMIRKRVLLESKLRYEEEFTPAEDHALFYRLMRYTGFHNLDEVLFRYRWHDSNTSRVQQQKMIAATAAIHAKVRLDYPHLYKKLLYTSRHVTRGKLFEVIPCLKAVRNGGTRTFLLFNTVPVLRTVRHASWVRYYLFGFIPVYSITEKVYAGEWDEPHEEHER